MSAARKTARGAKGGLKTLVRQAARAGWSVSITGGNHIRLEHPEAERPVYAPLTPRGRFAPQRLLGSLKRARMSTTEKSRQAGR